MAQSVPFTFWSAEQAPGYAGMKADSTVDVIDSYAAEEAIDAGVPVKRGTDPPTQLLELAYIRIKSTKLRIIPLVMLYPFAVLVTFTLK